MEVVCNYLVVVVARCESGVGMGWFATLFAVVVQACCMGPVRGERVVVGVVAWARGENALQGLLRGVSGSEAETGVTAKPWRRGVWRV